MSESMNALARRGLVSANAVLKATKVQKSKMAPFNGKGGRSDQGKGKEKGHALIRTGEINASATQADRAKSMPSKGARVNASYVPGKNAIDQFPRGQAKTFPAGGKVSAKGKKSVGVRGGASKLQGGQYGGPSSRAAG